MPELTLEERQPLLNALRKLEGRATIGDLMGATGLSRDVVEARAQSLLTTHRGHLEVSDAGDLVYRFDPALVRRDDRSSWERFRERGKAIAITGFKVWIMLMLVVYFVAYVAILIALLTRGSDNNSSSSSSSSNRGGGGGLHLLFYIFWTPDSRRGDRYYGDSKSDERKVPFYKKVFAFVFGADRVPPEQLEQQRREALTQLIRARRGVITAADIVELEGIPLEVAEEQIAELLGFWSGEVGVSRSGEVAYTFPELMTRTSGPVGAQSDPPMAWHQLEETRPLTGNKPKTDMIIGAINAFNLFMALIAPGILMPALGWHGTSSLVFIAAIPFIFSLIFFAIPLSRKIASGRERNERVMKNARKIVLKHVFSAARSEGEVDAAEVGKNAALLTKRETLESITEAQTSKALEITAGEFNGDIDANDRGDMTFRFGKLGEQIHEIDRVRARLKLEQRTLGEIVFSSADTPEEAEAREVSAFDKALAGDLPGEADLTRVDLSDLEDLDDFDARLNDTAGAADADTRAALDAFDADLEDDVEVMRRGGRASASARDRKGRRGD